MGSKEQHIQKLIKIKEAITSATDYLALEKCMQKFEKIKTKIGDVRNKKQILPILQTIDMLIKEKTKYFKQKMLKSSSKIIEEDQAQRTLKYSKSAETFIAPPKAQTSSNQTMYKYRPSKKYNSMTIDEKKSKTDVTEINIEGKYQEKVHQLEEKLLLKEKQLKEYQDKVRVLEAQSTSSISRIIKEKQDEIVDDYSKKLRDKSYYIEQLKGKVQHLQRHNEQLKNRVLNEQRRHEDYINDLRKQIRNLKKHSDKSKKQKRNLEQECADFEEKNQGLMHEIKRLAQKLENQIRDKEQIRKLKTEKNDRLAKNLEKEISHLTTQTSQINKLESELQAEAQYREQLKEKNKQLETRYEELQKEFKTVESEKEKIEESTYKFIEEGKSLRQQLKKTVMQKQLLVQQLGQVKQQLFEHIKLKQYHEYEKQLTLKNKVNKLKEIKYLFTELK